MEFLSLDQMCRLVRPAGWNRKDVLRAIESGQLAAMRVSSGRTTKLAIVHPGITFMDYLRDPLVRMGHIAILSERDVAFILNKSISYIRWLVHKKKIQTCANTCHGRGLRFTPEQVRAYIVRTSGRDPKKRAALTADVLAAWFLRLMEAQSITDPHVAVEEEFRMIDGLPEPERSQQIDKMLRLAEEARQQLAEKSNQERELRITKGGVSSPA